MNFDKESKSGSKTFGGGGGGGGGRGGGRGGESVAGKGASSVPYI